MYYLGLCTDTAQAALVRDTVYLDGGSIWWSPGLASGKVGKPVNNGKRLVYLQHR